MEQDDAPTDAEHDITNKAFWLKLAGVFAETQLMLREKAEEFGIDLDAIPPEDIEEEIEARHKTVRNESLSKQANFYAKTINEILPELENLADEEYRGELIQVVRWYQFLIATKMMRGLDARIDEDDEYLREVSLQERDGSIKVALISIDRSMAAWSGLYADNPHDRIKEIISLLDTLRRETEEKFPGARDFLRPGFDEIEGVM
jgi:hypothetical protein